MIYFADWSRIATQNKNPSAANISGPHYIYQNSAVVSVTSNNNSTHYSFSFFMFMHWLKPAHPVSVFAPPRLCVLEQWTIWPLQQRRHPQRDSPATYVPARQSLNSKLPKTSYKFNYLQLRKDREHNKRLLMYCRVETNCRCRKISPMWKLKIAI